MPTKRFFDSITRRDLALYWLLIAVSALLISGGLAFFTAIARTPVISNLFTDTDFFRRVLVAHVVLGVAVWFTALPVSFFHFVQDGVKPDRLSRLSSSLAFAGIILMVLTSFSSRGAPYLSNYIPVISHPLFITGLVFYLAGVAFNYLNSGLFTPRNLAPTNPFFAGLQSAQTGVRVGALYYLVSLATLMTAAVLMPVGFPGAAHFEVVMWGGGHVLQFANITFMLVCWTILLASWLGASPVTKKQACLIFMWLGAPVLLIPWLAGQDLVGPRYREGFTLLMRWGMFPPVLAYLYLAGRKAVEHKLFAMAKEDLRPLTFVLSAFLILSGFIFGSLVRGPDLRLPGHYHASIGAITISFMGAAYVLLRELGLIKNDFAARRAARVQLHMYGLGQFVFALGMFIAGSYGMSRKVYGVEQQLHTAGQTAGMWIMGAGGIVALAGGFAFVYLACKPLVAGFKPQARTIAKTPALTATATSSQ